jgi:hypothetical protein
MLRNISARRGTNAGAFATACPMESMGTCINSLPGPTSFCDHVLGGRGAYELPRIATFRFSAPLLIS